jgi:hypothetical protein
MIQIDGLTEYQVEMLDHMWSLKTQEEYEDWLSLLCEEDFLTARSLSILIALECLDKELDPNHALAKELLSKFAL